MCDDRDGRNAKPVSLGNIAACTRYFESRIGRVPAYTVEGSHLNPKSNAKHQILLKDCNVGPTYHGSMDSSMRRNDRAGRMRPLSISTLFSTGVLNAIVSLLILRIVELNPKLRKAVLRT